jgi:hypothetical protein
MKPRPSPCSSCPYRRDVPSGIWAKEEYEKLPAYDGDIPEQVEKGAFGVFLCHQANGFICSGWAGCHDMANNLACRMDHEVDPSILDYESPVPLFDSGAEAAAHGMRDIEYPGDEAMDKVDQLTKARSRRQQ